jgi:hypothetical protein
MPRIRIAAAAVASVVALSLLPMGAAQAHGHDFGHGGGRHFGHGGGPVGAVVGLAAAIVTAPFALIAAAAESAPAYGGPAYAPAPSYYAPPRAYYPPPAYAPPPAYYPPAYAPPPAYYAPPASYYPPPPPPAYYPTPPGYCGVRPQRGD